MPQWPSIQSLKFPLLTAGLSAAAMFAGACTVLCLPTLAFGEERMGFPAVATRALSRALAAPAGCPDQGGLLDSISVPVGEPLNLRVVIFSPAPPGGATFETSSDDPSVVAAGDRRQGFLPRVFIPEGQTVSNPFTIFGITVGRTLLRLTPLTPGFFPSAFPLGAWDVNKAGNEKFVDANPPANHCRADDASNDLSTDPTVLARCGSTVRNGIAADDVTQVLMRTISGLPGKVCFEITSTSNFDQGALQSQVLDTQTVGNREYGFTFYKAPGLFGDTADSRTLEMEFTFTPNIGNGNTSRFRAQTKIVRPPVLLLHGIWSKGGAWGGDYKKEDAFHTTYTGDYEATNGVRFATNFPRVQDFAKRAIEAARAKGFAVTQTDVVGHSMGGLLTRLYAGSAQLRRPDNFGKGDIRRLLTLDTPHSGSTFANLVAALHRVNPAGTDSAVRSITGFAPAGGALCDLAESSPALQGLNGSTTIAAQAITGTGGPPGSGAAPARFFGGFLGFGNIEGALTKTRCLHRNRFFICDREEFIFPQDIVDAFRFRQANDTIVALSSQQGGLAGINFPDVIHSGPSLVNGVLSTSDVATRTYELLDGPVSGFSGSFPGVGSSGTGVPTTVPGRGAAQDQADYANQCGPGGTLNAAITRGLETAFTEREAAALDRGPGPRAAAPPDDRVQITSPTDRQVFAPGDTVHIVVRLSSPLVANDIGVAIPGFDRLEGTNYDGSQYEATFVIPAFFAGPLTLTPEITDTDNVPISGLPITIGAVPAPPPLSIALQQSDFRITLPTDNSSESLALRGTYPGPISYDLTSSITGTSYESTSPAVVTVSREGVYRVEGPGIAVIKVTNSGLTAFAVFVVDDRDHPLPPLDVTAQFSVKGGGFRLDRTSGFFVQNVVIASQQDVPVPGPLYLVVAGLPSGVNLVNQSGVTEEVQPGDPFITLPLSSDGLNVQPGESQTLTLRFLNPKRTNISYSATIHWTSGTP